MAFDWRDYLTLAEALVEGPDEAQWRTAISRAYYAAYHHARGYLMARFSVTVPRIDGHKFVWDALKEGGGRTREELAAAHTGKSLRDARNQADYESRFSGDVKAKAKEAIRHSQRIIETLPLS